MEQGKILRKLRMKLGLSQEQVAAKLGTTRNTWQRWETGLATPSPMHTFRIVDVAQGAGFPLTVDELVAARFAVQAAARGGGHA